MRQEIDPSELIRRIIESNEELDRINDVYRNSLQARDDLKRLYADHKRWEEERKILAKAARDYQRSRSNMNCSCCVVESRNEAG